MRSWTARNIVYYPIQTLRGQKVKLLLNDVIARERCSRKELEQIRDDGIKKIIASAYTTSEYYRHLFDSRGIKPDKIRGYDDLVYLPILNKRDILINRERMINPNIYKRVYTRKTSGSTGITLSFYKEANALAMNDAIMWRCYRWYGIEVGDRQARFWGVPVSFISRMRERCKDIILNRIRISAFDISPSSCSSHYDRIIKFQPDYIYGYTTAIYGFCLHAQQMGLNFSNLGIKAVICTAEKMYTYHRELLEEMFSCPIVDEYGSSENGIIAFQCRYGNMHMMSDHLCIEFLNDQNERVKPGESGRVVITDLSSYAMPLIRYDIADIARPSSADCPCGINLPLMEIVEGRKEDFIRLQDGRMIHAAYLCYTLKDDAVWEFKMHQKELNKFLVQIVKSPSFTLNTEKKLEQKLKSSLGVDVYILFEYLEKIPREKSGKLRYFVSEVQ